MSLLARLALARPLLVLALLAVATAAVAKGLFRLELRTDGAAIYPQGDPAVERTLADRQSFFEADQIILLVTARPGGPLLASPAGFRFLRRLQATLARFPGIEIAGVRSVVTLIDPPVTLQPLRLATFFEEWSGGDGDFAAVLARLRRLPVASGLFLSADGAAAAFYVPVGPRSTRTELLAGLRRFLRTRGGAPFRLRLTGPVAAEADLGEEVVRDLSRLVPVMVAAVALLLGLTLRTPGGVLIPLAQVLATLVWTLGLMGWTGVPVTLVTTVLPVLLMAMAMTDEIYLLERLQDHLAAAAWPGADAAAAGPGAEAAASQGVDARQGADPRQGAVAGWGVVAGQGAAAVRGAVAGAGRGALPAGRVRWAAEWTFADLTAPLALISLATAAGFFSFVGASMAPLRHLGLFTGLGLLLGMLFTFTLAPALMMALPASWVERRQRRPAGGHLPWFERLTVRRGRQVALAVAILLALAVPGLGRLRVEDSWIDNFDPRSPLVTAARRFDAEFWGSYRFDVVASGPAGWAWTPPAAALLERLERWAGRAPSVGGMVSVLPAFQAGARALDFPRPLSALPEPRMRRVGMLVEILRIRLYLKDLLNLDGSRLRARLLVRNADYSKARRLSASFAAALPEIVEGNSGGRAGGGGARAGAGESPGSRRAGGGGATPGAGEEPGVRRDGPAAEPPIEVHASGEVPVALAVVGSIVGNQLRSIAWTAVLIAAMLLAALRSLRWTAVVMAPVLAATVLLFAALGYAGTPLGIATSMFAALNLGAGVDFAVQYVYAYRRERRAAVAAGPGAASDAHGRGPRHHAAVAAALATTGRGLRWNAMVLALGIAVLSFSTIKPNSSLGLLLALAILVSYVTTLALVPELLRRLSPTSEGPRLAGAG
jgi:predicted RND superfamily exporter protein